jgi:hypothetical protein
MIPNRFQQSEDLDSKQRKVPVCLSDLQYQPNTKAATFYEQYRNLVIGSLKKKGYTITWQNNMILAEDEKLSPTFEELILDNVLGLIDTRLPRHVRSYYFELMEEQDSLMEYKNDILDKVPSFLEKMKIVSPSTLVISEEGLLAR